MTQLKHHSLTPPTGYFGCTAHQVRRLSRTLVKLYDRHLAGVDMTPLSTAQLALELAADRTTMTRALRPLLDRDWLAYSLAADGRTRLLRLTDTGLEQLRLARPYWRQVQKLVENTIGQQHFEAFHNTAESLRLALEQQLLLETHHDRDVQDK
jgi:DNA-binding MarR family transcriptional regulator